MTNDFLLLMLQFVVSNTV